MKKIFLFYFTIVCAVCNVVMSQTPSFVWVRPGVVSSAGYYAAVGNRIATDSVGNNYITGSFTGSTFTLGSTVLTSTSGNFQTLFVAKYDAKGNLIWAMNAKNCYASGGYNIALDATASKVYVTGAYLITSGTGSFGSKNFLGGFNSMFVAQMDASNGDVLWLKCTDVGPSQNTNTASGGGITVYGNNNIYVTGSFKGTVSFGTFSRTSVGYYDMFLVKYDNAGNEQWVTTAGYKWITGDQAAYQAGGTSLTTDNSGSVYMAGQYKAGLVIGTDTYVGDGSDHVFIAKYDASGNYGWSRHSNGGSSSQAATKLVMDAASNNLYLSGCYGPNGISFNGLPSLPYNPAGQNPVYNIFVVKYDLAGTFQWQKTPGGGFNCLAGPGIVFDRNNDFYITGGFRTNATFGSTILNVVVNGNTEDVYVAKFDKDCTPLWAKSAAGTYSEAGRDIGADKFGNVYLTGSMGAGNTSVDISFDTITETVSPNEGYFYVAKIGTILPPVNFTAGDTVICQNSSVTFYDQSALPDTSRKWTFAGGTPGSSTDQNPTITYNLPGTYDVKLAVKTGPVTDSLIKAGYIVVRSRPVLGTVTADPDSVCAGNTSQLKTTGNTGSVHWQSSITGNNFSDVSGAVDTIYQTQASQTTFYRIIADNGTCSDTSLPAKLVVSPIPASPLITTSDTLICSGDSAQICPYGSYAHYLWSNAATGSCIEAKNAGGYWLTVSDANGCSAVSNHLNISVHPVPSVSIIVQGDTLSSYGANAYQWIRNGNALTGDTSAIYIAYLAGHYALQVTDSNGCKAISNEVAIGDVAIHDFQPGDIGIYPNPASGSFHITYSGTGAENFRFGMFNMIGEKVMQETMNFSGGKTISINVSPLPKGLYLLQLQSEHSNWMRKILVK